MKQYTAPTVTDLGSFAELTMSNLGTKSAGTGDFVVIGGTDESAPGGTLIS